MNALKDWLDKTVIGGTLKDGTYTLSPDEWGNVITMHEMLCCIAEPDPALVEVVAQAIYRDLYKEGLNELTEQDWEDMRERFEDEARAGLEALAQELVK